MKSKSELLKEMFGILAELESGTVQSKDLKSQLQIQLAFLYEFVLDDEDIEECWWERIEEAISME